MIDLSYCRSNNLRTSAYVEADIPDRRIDGVHNSLRRDRRRSLHYSHEGEDSFRARSRRRAEQLELKVASSRMMVQTGSNAGPVVGSLRFLGFAAKRSSLTSLRLLVSRKLDSQSFAQWAKAARLIVC